MLLTCNPTLTREFKKEILYFMEKNILDDF